jgi:hypothetical protein
MSILEEFEQHIYFGKKFPKYKEKAFKVWKELHGRKYVGFNDCDEDVREDALNKFVEIIKTNKIK